MKKILQPLQIILLKKKPQPKTYQLDAEQWPKIQLECYESLGKEQNRNHNYLTA